LHNTWCNNILLAYDALKERIGRKQAGLGPAITKLNLWCFEFMSACASIELVGIKVMLLIMKSGD